MIHKIEPHKYYPEFRNQEPKPTDYLLIIRNYFDNEKFAHLVERLRAVPDIIAVYQIDLSRNKLLNSILEDIEMHEMWVLSKDMGE